MIYFDKVFQEVSFCTPISDHIKQKQTKLQNYFTKQIHATMRGVSWTE